MPDGTNRPMVLFLDEMEATKGGAPAEEASRQQNQLV